MITGAGVHPPGPARPHAHGTVAAPLGTAGGTAGLWLGPLLTGGLPDHALRRCDSCWWPVCPIAALGRVSSVLNISVCLSPHRVI